MGKIERPPGWILKYKEGIEAGTITVEQILEEENKLRETPIKISSVTRAINAMGHPITGLRGRTKGGASAHSHNEAGEMNNDTNEVEKAPEWLQKYRDRIEAGTITVEQILDEENERRTTPIKIATVKRAVNALGYPVGGMSKEAKDELEDREETQEREDTPSEVQKGPGWLQKYHDQIVAGTITVDEILAEENKTREHPIKRSSVTRAINAMGYQTSKLQQEEKTDVSEAGHSAERSEEATGAEKGPGWLQKYHDRIEVGTITVDEILAEENKTREHPIKRSSVTRAINAMGFTIAGMRQQKREAARVEEKVKETARPEAIVYGSRLDKLSETTLKRFSEVKKSWEEDLGKPLHNDYFLNLLLALAKLAEHGKTLTSVQS